MKLRLALPGRAPLKRGDQAYLNDLNAAQAINGTPEAVWVIYLLVITVVTAITWANWAQVDEVTRTDARVVPEQREQVIASLEGGLLRELYVREGAQVEEGQDLLQLDPTRFAAQQNEGQARRMALRGTLARLTAEAYGRPLRFPPELDKETSIVDAETEAYNARKLSLDEAVSANRRSGALVRRELGVSEQMSAAGLLSEVEVMRLRRQINDLELTTQERINRFRQDASTELVKVKAELAQLDEQLVGREDQLKRTVLKSPVKGIVKNIRVGTLGGVVGAGAPVMEIVPLTGRTMLEARVKPRDIGFLRMGQKAEIKLAAYDYTTYGSLQGEVVYISPDALGDPERAAADGTGTYYRVLVRAEGALRSAKPLQILPGMTATVDVQTGKRSVLNFILRPLRKSQEAFTER